MPLRVDTHLHADAHTHITSCTKAISGNQACASLCHGNSSK